MILMLNSSEKRSGLVGNARGT